jgi:23S rRNA (uracil1939-C5)-methyltransferase
MTYDQQLSRKKRAFEETLLPLLDHGQNEKSAKKKTPGNEITVHVEPIIPSKSPWGYRISTKLVLGEDSFGSRKIGLYQKNSKNIADIPDCPVHHPTINQVIRGLFGSLRDQVPAPFYRHDLRSFQEGKLKFLVIRLNANAQDPSLGMILVHTGVERTELEKWAQQIDLTQVALFEATLSAQDDTLVIPHDIRHLGGEKNMKFSLGNHITYLNPSVFFQANGPMTGPFVSLVTDSLAKDTKGFPRYLLDLYGGIGSYSFGVGKTFDHTWLVEAHPEAIKAALDRQKREGFLNLTALTMTVEQFLKTNVPWDKITDCVVNPPRSGLGKSTAQALALKLKNIKKFVYVSCNPATMVADINHMLERLPLRSLTLQPIDMFPQTEHLECVATLENPS